MTQLDFRYELARAVCPEERWPDLDDCTEGQQEWIGILLGEEYLHPAFMGSEDTTVRGPEINLIAPDSDIITFFAEWLKAERRRTGITPAIRAYSTRDVPEDWIDLIKRANAGEVLGDADRSRLSKARKEGKRWAKTVRMVLRKPKLLDPI